MRRGDIVAIAAPGDHGKPRPAVIVQSNRLVGADSVIVCPLTTPDRDAPLFRLSVEPTAASGLHSPSFVVVEKAMAIRAGRCGRVLGRLDGETIRRLDERPGSSIGLADAQV